METKKSLSNEQLSIIKQMHAAGESIHAISKVLRINAYMVEKHLDEALRMQVILRKVFWPPNYFNEYKLMIISLHKQLYDAKLRTRIGIEPLEVVSNSLHSTEKHHQLDIHIRSSLTVNEPDKRIRFFIPEDLLEKTKSTSDKIFRTIVEQDLGPNDEFTYIWEYLR